MAPRNAEAQKAVRCLTDIDWMIRKAAVETLANLGTAAANQTAALTSVLESDTNPQVRAAAARAIWSVDKPSGAAAAMARHLNDRNLEVRRVAMHVLRGCGADAAPFAQLVAKRLGDSDKLIQLDAIRLLVCLGAAGTPFIADVVGLLRNGDRDSQIEAALALGRLGAREGPHVVALVSFLREAPMLLAQDARREAAKSLCKLGAVGNSVIEVLLPFLADDRVRRAVKASLRRFGAASASAVAHELSRKKTPCFRLAAVKFLASLGGAACATHAKILADCLADQDAQVRFQAARGLAESAGGDVCCASALATCLTDSNEAVRIQAAKALGRIGNAAGAHLVALTCAANVDRSERVRTASVQALVAIEALYLLLTLHMSPCDAEGLVGVSCISLAGEEIAAVEAEIGRPLREVEAAIVCELGSQPFRMVLSSGRALTADDLDRPFAEFVEDTPAGEFLGDELF